jgi:hypothetical protein
MAFDKLRLEESGGDDVGGFASDAEGVPSAPGSSGAEAEVHPERSRRVRLVPLYLSTSRHIHRRADRPVACALNRSTTSSLAAVAAAQDAAEAYWFT